MKPVVVGGFMGTGKSTVAPALAARLDLPFVDTDTEIERAAGKSIPELWRAEGEAAFRNREFALIERLLGDGIARVIAVGGGAMTIDRARRLAVDRALVVTLTASPETSVSRAPDLARRPNLAVGGDPLARARELIAARAPAYGECHLSVATDTLDVEAVVRAIEPLVARDPILVPLGVRSYSIDVCDGEASRLTDAIQRCAPSSLVLVTDSNVDRLRHAAIEAAIRPVHLPTVRVTLPPGEAQKTLASVGAIWDAALGAGVDRGTLVVAVGGGVVGDLAGFAAACLLRGVRFVQAPTTVLSMVDSSVGGKTGCDHPAGKNLVGAFHQPSSVVVDLAHLETLPARERAAGLAEVVKMAVSLDAALFDEIEANAPALARGDRGALRPVVRSAILAKVRVVRDDEREAGPRAILNLGHTVGHALESFGGYAKWLHGEAVALGLVVEMKAAERLGRTPPALTERVRKVLASLDLPTEVAASDVAASWRYVGADKKRAGSSLSFAVVTGAGVSHIERIPLTELKEAVLRG
ncbi:MAG TPA: 3-dehydroquinate synthase [Polyangiaceae bacterium]|jgi:shikimate kinase/3-dehydroquinate synthase